MLASDKYYNEERETTMKNHMLAITTAAAICVGAPSISLAKTTTETTTQTIKHKKKIFKKKTVKYHRHKKQTDMFKPTAPFPVKTDSTPTSTPQALQVHHKVHAKKHEVAVEPEKCHFLFWEVPCNNDSSNTVASEHKSVPVNKGMAMIGLNAKKNKQELENYFESKIEMKVDPTRIPWCAAFANSILASSGYETTASLAARSFLNYGIPTKNPEEGDIVVFSRGHGGWSGHVGFYMNTVTLDGRQYIAVLGGNQGKSVNIAYYPANKVLGYRKPVQA